MLILIFHEILCECETNKINDVCVYVCSGGSLISFVVVIKKSIQNCRELRRGRGARKRLENKFDNNLFLAGKVALHRAIIFFN